MPIATLDSIRIKIRRLTGSGTSLQLTDAQINDYIDSFYSYDFPAQFRSLKLKDIYTFNTIRGIDTYPFDSEHYTTVEQPAYCMNRAIAFFNNPWPFYGVNYNWQYQNNFATCNGLAGPYSGFTSAKPLIRSVNNNPANTQQTTPAQVPYPVSRVQNLLITTNVMNGITYNVTDSAIPNSNLGNLIGDCVAGQINYETGAITNLTFSGPTTPGQPIQIQYNPTQLNIPLSILYFQNQFTLRPVPDKGYTIQIVAYRSPSQALLTSPASQGLPELNEWWETIAFGASKKIYQDRLDMDGVIMMDQFLQQAYSLNETRTYAQLGKQSVSTIYKDQLAQNYGAVGIGFGGVAN